MAALTFDDIEDEVPAKSRALTFDDVPDDEGVLASIAQTGLGKAVGASIDKVTDIMRNPAKQNPASNALQIVGQGAGLAFAPVAEAVSAAIPNAAKEYIATSAPVQKWNEFSRAYPEVSGDIGAAANLIGVKPAGKLATAATKEALPIVGGAVEAGSSKIYNAAENAFQAKKKVFVSNLYDPKPTAGVLRERAANTITEGLNQKQVYNYKPYELEAIEELSKLPVKASNTLQANYNVAKNAVSKEAANLEFDLSKTPVIYKSDYFNNKLASTLDDLLTKEPNIVGDGKTVAKTIVNKMAELADLNPKTPAGLLKARKQFDKWATSKRAGVFDANDTAFSTSVRAARNATNQAIIDIAPNANVAASLKRQTNLLNAMDNMETKIPQAAKTRIGMAAEKTGKLIPVKGALIKAGLGVAGLGAGYVTGVLPAAAALGAVGLAIKGAKSPSLWKGVGATGKVIGKGIKNSVKPSKS